MTQKQVTERFVEAIDPHLSQLEARACPVLSQLAEAARQHLHRLYDALALMEGEH